MSRRLASAPRCSGLGVNKLIGAVFDEIRHSALPNLPARRAVRKCLFNLLSRMKTDLPIDGIWRWHAACNDALEGLDTSPARNVSQGAGHVHALRLYGTDAGATAHQIEQRLLELTEVYGSGDDRASQRQFELIKQAYEVLSDPEQRKVYDVELARAAWVADCELKWESGNKPDSLIETFPVDWDAFPSVTLNNPLVEEIERALLSKATERPVDSRVSSNEHFHMAA